MSNSKDNSIPATELEFWMKFYSRLIIDGKLEPKERGFFLTILKTLVSEYYSK